VQFRDILHLDFLLCLQADFCFYCIHLC